MSENKIVLNKSELEYSLGKFIEYQKWLEKKLKNSTAYSREEVEYRLRDQTKEGIYGDILELFQIQPHQYSKTDSIEVEII